jgi:hypothetical protein
MTKPAPGGRLFCGRLYPTKPLFDDLWGMAGKHLAAAVSLRELFEIRKII